MDSLGTEATGRCTGLIGDRARLLPKFFFIYLVHIYWIKSSFFFNKMFFWRRLTLDAIIKTRFYFDIWPDVMADVSLRRCPACRHTREVRDQTPLNSCRKLVRILWLFANCVHSLNNCDWFKSDSVVSHTSQNKNEPNVSASSESLR